MKSRFSVLLFLLLLVVFFAKAQSTESQDLGEFTEIKVYDQLRVRLIHAETNKIELSGRYTDDIKLVNNNGLLKVKMNWDKAYDGEDTSVKIYYKDLQLIDGNEGAIITILDTISNEEIELRAQEGAQIMAKLKVKNAHIRAVSGGIIKLNGTADFQEVKISTGGIYEGKTLQTAATEARVQAGGDAEVYAKEFAELTVRAGGDIHVYGNPRNIEKTKFIAGSIKIIE